jgi:hypothetical protein
MVHVGAKASDEGTSDYFKKMIPMGRLGAGTAEGAESAPRSSIPSADLGRTEPRGFSGFGPGHEQTGNYSPGTIDRSTRYTSRYTLALPMMYFQ